MQSLFGTDGIRGNINSPLFSQESLVNLGIAIGTWIVDQYGTSPTVLIGTDTRHSASFIKNALSNGLMTSSANILDALVLPTPAAAHILPFMPDIHAVVIISASHNPAEDNGIKLFTKTTGKLKAHDEQCITDYFVHKTQRAPAGPRGIMTQFPFASTLYLESVAALFETLDARDYHVVLDTAHGAMSTYAEQAFTRTGAQVTTLHNAPDGYNINQHCGSTAPYRLQKAVHHYQADIGFAFDGDGDRVIAVNRYGEIKNGDDLLCLLLNHPHYQATRTVVGTIMTNCGFEHHLKEREHDLIRTSVGDRHVSDMLSQKQLLLGGEPSGHVILNNHVATGDGLLVALKVLETFIHTNNDDITTFEPYAQIAHKIPIKTKHSLSDEPFTTIIQEAQLHCTDGRVIVRYSGTEQVLRVMVETKELYEAQRQCAQLVYTLERTFNSLAH